MKYVNAILILALVTAGAWWLSGYDTRLSGEDTPADRRRRFIRTVVTVFLVTMICWLPAERESLIAVYAISLLLAIFWIGPVTECLSHTFHQMAGMAATNRPHDPGESLRNADTMAGLIRDGKKAEAVQLYEQLKASGDANIVVLETLLHRAGIAYQGFKKPQPLLDARDLQAHGKFIEAEMILKSLLQQNAGNLDAGMMLIRLYVHDLRDRDKAVAVLQQMIHQPDVPAVNIEYAQQLIRDFGIEKTAPALEPLPASVDDLLAAGYFGTAIELLEREAAERPGEFPAQLRLIEAHALHSRDFATAKRMVKEMETRKSFTAEQIGIAKAKLEEWRAAKPQK